MAKENKASKRDLAGAFKVILRIVRDTRPIAFWLLLAVVISLLSVALSTVAPELLGALTDRIYNFINFNNKQQ